MSTGTKKKSSPQKRQSKGRTKTAAKSAAKRAKPEPVRIPTEKLAKWHNDYFDIRESDIQGRGAFANRKIRKGTRIIEYTGERISNAVADDRYDESRMRRHHTFLFTLTPRTVVDGAVNGNESIYINHSCDPNCETIIEDGRIWVEAIRTIQEGEELGYDYQYERTGENDEELERFYKCNCGAPNCRGSIMKPAAPPRPRKGKTTRRNKAGNTRVKR